MTPYIRDLKKKQAVTAQSLEKIEDGRSSFHAQIPWFHALIYRLGLFLNLRLVSATYAIVVRSSEYDIPTEMLDDIVAKSISKFTGNSGHGHDVRRRQTDDTSGDEGE